MSSLSKQDEFKFKNKVDKYTIQFKLISYPTTWSQSLGQLRITFNGLRADWISDRKNLYTFITTSN